MKTDQFPENIIVRMRNWSEAKQSKSILLPFIYIYFPSICLKYENKSLLEKPKAEY